MNVLIVAAHPDDEVLGCGGTMARYAAEGNDIHILILGEGVTSRYKNPADAPSEELAQLHEQAQTVGSFLGAKSVAMGGFPDNRFDTVALLDIVKMIEDKIAEIKPSIVCTQHGGDLNIDHEYTFRAVMTATRPLEGSSVKRVYAYEVPSSTEWSFQKFAPTFKPNSFVDINTTLEKKVEAMAMYENETRTFPHPRSPEALRAHAHYWGSVAGLKAAEAFELIREIQ